MKHWSKIKESAGSIWLLNLVFFIYKFLKLKNIFLILHPISFFYYCFSPSKRAVSRSFFKRVARYKVAVKPSFRTTYRHFYSFSLSLIERIAAWNHDIKVEDLIIKNQDVYEDIIARIQEKKGCFFLCSHLGNIDLLRALSMQENKDGVHKTKVNIIVDTAMSSRFNNFMRSIQEKFDINIINSRSIGLETGFLLQEKLNSGEILVIAGDRTPSENSNKTLALPLLGDDIFLPYGSFLLPVILEFPVYYFFALRENDTFISKYDFFLYKSAVNLTAGQKNERIRAIMYEYIALLEEKVLEYPLQWYNFFDMWKEVK